MKLKAEFIFILPDILSSLNGFQVSAKIRIMNRYLGYLL